jgi:F-type H+-transporting ATPase subunit a
MKIGGDKDEYGKPIPFNAIEFKDGIKFIPNETMSDLIADDIQPDQLLMERFVALKNEERTNKYEAELAQKRLEQASVVLEDGEELEPVENLVVKPVIFKKEDMLYPKPLEKGDVVTEEQIIAYHQLRDELAEFGKEHTYGSITLFKFFDRLFNASSPVKWFGEDSSIFNFRLWRMLIYVDIFIILLALLVNFNLAFIPTKIQVVFELIYTFFEDLINETLGERAKDFIPYILTLFLFIFISNWASLLPIPGISEPTKNLNVPFGLGMMAICVVHYNSLKKKGLYEYCKAYCEPLIFLLPLNLVGEVSKVVSISFRLFGNLFGGAIIGLVVSTLTLNIIVPVGLNMFFVMFAGTIQAFVFTMLSLTYLSNEIAD